VHCSDDFFSRPRPRLYSSFKTKTKPSVQDLDQYFASTGSGGNNFSEMGGEGVDLVTP